MEGRTHTHMAPYSKLPWLYWGLVVIATGSIILWDVSAVGDPNNYHNELFACLTALISLFALYVLRPHNSLLNYCIVCIPYAIVTARFLFSSDLPIHDSWMYHFPIFQYIGDVVAQNKFFPAWIPSSGGIRIGFFHINLLLTLPHRILGYVLYAILPISAVSAYKLQYILGVAGIGFGWWLFLLQITRSRYAAYFGALAIMMGGTGITFHQEQVLATTYLLPWFALSLWKLRQDSAYIVPAVALFGLGLTTHYPQIQIISMGLLIVLWLLWYPAALKNIYTQRKRIIPLLVLVVIAVCLPSLYLLYHIDTLESSHRVIRPESYEAYLALMSGFNSALPKYFYQYIAPMFQWLPIHPDYGCTVDYCSFFIGRTALILALVGVIWGFPKTIPLILLLGIFVSFTLGIHSVLPIPRWLYLIRFPFISSFRQWLHFFPLINFCLSVLAAIGLARVERSGYWSWKNIGRIGVMVILFLHITDLAWYDKQYLAVFHTEATPAKLTGAFFARDDHEPSNIFQYKNRYILHHFCPRSIPTVSFLTTRMVSVTSGINTEIETACKALFQGETATVTNIPPSLLPTFAAGDSQQTSIPCENCIQPDGLAFTITTPNPALFVTPLNYDINAKAYIDEKETNLWRVNGALSGIFVEQGTHRIEFKISHDTYGVTVLMQLLLFTCLIIFFVKKRLCQKTSFLMDTNSPGTKIG